MPGGLCHAYCIHLTAPPSLVVLESRLLENGQATPLLVCVLKYKWRTKQFVDALRRAGVSVREYLALTAPQVRRVKFSPAQFNLIEQMLSAFARASVDKHVSAGTLSLAVHTVKPWVRVQLRPAHCSQTCSCRHVAGSVYAPSMAACDWMVGCGWSFRNCANPQRWASHSDNRFTAASW